MNIKLKMYSTKQDIINLLDHMSSNVESLDIDYRTYDNIEECQTEIESLVSYIETMRTNLYFQIRDLRSELQL